MEMVGGVATTQALRSWSGCNTGEGARRPMPQEAAPADAA